MSKRRTGQVYERQNLVKCSTLFIILFAGLIKKTLRKFKQMELRNEINVTAGGKCNLSVSPTVAGQLLKLELISF